MKYAKEGYLFYSVETPSFFREVELPEKAEDMTTAQERKLRSLQKDAEKYGTHVRTSTYQRG
jgi:hypothetical protein